MFKHLTILIPDLDKLNSHLNYLKTIKSSLIKAKPIYKKDHTLKKMNSKFKKIKTKLFVLKQLKKKKKGLSLTKLSKLTKTNLSIKTISQNSFFEQQTTTPSKSEDQNLQIFYKEETQKKMKTINLSSQNQFQLPQIKQNIESIIYNQRQLRTRKLCPKFQSIRSQFIVYIREKASLLKLSRQSCQLVIYYMDEYFSNNQYQQKQILLIILTFFVIASKAIQQYPLNMSKVAQDNGVALSLMTKTEQKSMKALQYKLMPTTYIPLLNEILFNVSQNKQIGLNLFEEKIQSYLIMRKIYYICQELHYQMGKIDLVNIKIVINFVLKKVLRSQKFAIFEKIIIGEIAQDKSINLLLKELYAESIQKEKQCILDFYGRAKCQNYGVFLNAQK